MNSWKTKGVALIAAFLMLSLSTAMADTKDKYTKAGYEAKVKTNDHYVGVVAGVVNTLCPMILTNPKKVCNKKDPVGSALGIQKVMLMGFDDLDDVDEDKMARKVTHVGAALQFFDAVEQFKGFFGPKKAAAAAAKKGNWKEASISEELAWQYIVKTASRAMFAKSMLIEAQNKK